MRTRLFVVAALAMLGLSANARSDDAADCRSAFDESQVKRDQGKLIEARTLFRVCGRPSCSPTMQRLCSRWAADADARIPSFVLSAKDASNADVEDVTVTMDGVQVATKLGGREIEVDPGPHTFVFERADGARAETRAIAEERGKGKVVSVRLSPPAPPPCGAPGAVCPPPRKPVEGGPAGAGAGGGGAVGGGGVGTAAGGGGGSALKVVGLVAGGLGIVGLGLGAGFGLAALSTKSAHCDSSGACDPGTARTAYDRATVSTAGFVAGGVLLGLGATLFLLAPSGGTEHPAASVTIGPMVGSSAGGLELGGTW
jgi:hypothetical protein